MSTIIFASLVFASAWAASTPVAPSSLGATAASASQINLSWTDNSTNETGFVIQRYQTAVGTWVQVGVVGANVKTYPDTGLLPSSSYTYHVYAYNSTGISANSGNATATTLATGSDTTAPTVPAGLTATATASSQINLSWSASTDTGGSGLAGYNIYRAGVKIATTTATTWFDTGRSPSTQYCYTVAAYDKASNLSAKSAQVCATTPAATDTTAPTVPAGLTATATASSQINLSWSASTDTGGSGLAGYNIYRAGVKIATTTATTWFDTGRSPSTQYCYTVAAYDKASNLSAKSAQACATTPAATDTTAPTVPGGLIATAVSSSQINLSWSASTDTGGSGLAGYNIYRTGVKIATTTATTWSDASRSPSTQYCYTVAAYDKASNLSAKSAQACATTVAATDTTAPTAPGALTATAVSSSQVNLSWSTSTDTGGSGLAGYKIYRAGIQIATTTASTYSDTGRLAGTLYCYRVAAYDNAGNTSSQGTQACATTSTAPDTTVPTVPGGLSATAASSSQINLSWGASMDTGGSGLAGYKVYRGGVQLATTMATSYSDTSRSAGTQYCYTIAAYDNAGNSSAQSASACATTSQAASSTNTMVLVGFVPSVGSAHQVVVTNNIAYVASDNFGLALVNVTYPAAPAMLSSANVPFDGGSVAVRGTIACVTGQRQYYVPMGQPNAGSLTNVFGFYVYDISVSTNCALLGKIESGTIGFKGVAISGNYAYVACGGSGVKVINITVPTLPAIVGTGYDTPGWANTVAINGSYAYVADSSQGLRILNVSNPLALTHAGWVDTPGTANSVTLAGNYAYVSDLSSLQIIDVSNPTLPVIRGVFTTATTGGSFVEARILGTVAYVAANGAGLLTLNVNNPALPTRLGSLITSANGTVGVTVQGSYAYLANQNTGLEIVNITNPSAPAAAGNLSDWFEANYLAGKPGIAVVTGLHAWDGGLSAANGLRVINISNYKAPKIVGVLDSTAIGFNGLSVTGNYAYVACGASGLKVVDISNPAAPLIVGTGSDTPGWANGVTINGSYAYVADGSQGLRIINVSNPLAPTQVGFVDTPGTAYAVTVVGNTAYVADSSSLQIIDVSNKAAPVIRGSFTTATTGGTMLDVRVAGTTAYVAGNGAGLIILNVSNPAVPSLLSQITTGPNGTIGVNVSGTKAYVANQDYGVTTINVANPSVPVAGASVLSIGSVRNLMLDGNWLCSSDTLGSIDTIQVAP